MFCLSQIYDYVNKKKKILWNWGFTFILVVFFVFDWSRQPNNTYEIEDYSQQQIHLEQFAGQ